MFYTAVQHTRQYSAVFKKQQEILYLFCRQFFAVSNSERIFKIV